MTEERVLKILRRFPTWWKKDSDSNTYGLVKSFSDSFDAFSIQSYNMKDEIYVETATGTYLDDLAKLFKLSRKSGETDDQLRARIKAYWPGFSGGGTRDAIKTTVHKITGVPEDDVTVTDVPDELKINVEVVIPDAETMALMPTIEDVIWDIKAAGVYPFIIWVLNGDLVADGITIGDSVTITPVATDTYFRWELSLIDGEAVIS